MIRKKLTVTVSSF